MTDHTMSTRVIVGIVEGIAILKAATGKAPTIVRMATDSADELGGIENARHRLSEHGIETVEVCPEIENGLIYILGDTVNE